jgi:molybdate transport system substrate-binding protein
MIRFLLAFLVVCVAGTAAAPAWADDIRVLAAVGYKSILNELGPSYEKQSGHKVRIEYDSIPAIARRVAGNEKFDLLITTQDAVEKLVGEKKVIDDSLTLLAKVGVGVATRLQDPWPNVGNIEVLRRTLLSAHAIAYASPSAGGAFYPQLFQRLGVLSEVQRKSVTVVGAFAAQRVASNQADVALALSSEIVSVPGVRFAGAIPVPLQSYITYAAAMGLQAANSDAVTGLLAWLSNVELDPMLRAKGMEIP